jgi:hypothetical protein
VETASGTKRAHTLADDAGSVEDAEERVVPLLSVTLLVTFETRYSRAASIGRSAIGRPGGDKGSRVRAIRRRPLGTSHHGKSHVWIALTSSRWGVSAARGGSGDEQSRMTPDHTGLEAFRAAFKSLMLAHGSTREFDRQPCAGRARTVMTHTVRIGEQTIEVGPVTITDAGRRAGCSPGPEPGQLDDDAPAPRHAAQMAELTIAY